MTKQAIYSESCVPSEFLSTFSLNDFGKEWNWFLNHTRLSAVSSTAFYPLGGWSKSSLWSSEAPKSVSGNRIWFSSVVEAKTIKRIGDKGSHGVNRVKLVFTYIRITVGGRSWRRRICCLGPSCFCCSPDTASPAPAYITLAPARFLPPTPNMVAVSVWSVVMDLSRIYFELMLFVWYVLKRFWLAHRVWYTVNINRSVCF